MAKTEEISPAWLEYDQAHFIHKIKLYYKFYTDWFRPDNGCVETIEKWERCVNQDTDIDVSVYQGGLEMKYCGRIELTYGLEQSDQIYTLVCNEEGDAIVFSKTSGDLMIFEVVVVRKGLFAFREKFRE